MKQTAKFGCRVLVALLILTMLVSVISVPAFAAPSVPGIPSDLAGGDMGFLMDLLEQYNKVKDDENAADQMKEYVEDKYNSDESFKESADNFVGGSSTDGEDNSTLDNMNSVIENVFKDEFTITWVVDESTAIEVPNVPYGETPVFPGDVAALSYEVAGFKYTFQGWSPVIVAAKADATYTAIYTVEQVDAAGSISVTFVTATGTSVLKFDNQADVKAFADGLNTAKPDDKNFTYTFAGWKVEGEGTETQVWTADYTKTEIQKSWSDILTSGKVVEDYFGSIDNVMDAVQNGASVEDLKDSIQHQQKVEQEKAEAEERGEEYVEPTYTVTWNLDGKTLTEQTYTYKQMIMQPASAVATAGKYVSWDMTYVLMPDQNVTIYGETVDIVEEIVADVNGMPMNYGEYEMTFVDGVATLYVNVTVSDYNDILRDILGDVRGGTAQSAYREAIMSFLQSSAMHMYSSKTNTIDVNGYEVFGIEGYGASQLLELLNTVQSGNYGEIVSADGLKKAILSDPITPADVANVGDDGVLATYDVVLGAEGKQDYGFEFRVALKGNLELIRASAEAVKTAIGYAAAADGDLNVEIFVPGVFTQMLTKALNDADVSDSTKQTIVAGMSECATVGELFELFDLLEYDQFVTVVEYLFDHVDAMDEKEAAILKKIEAARPAFELFKKYGDILIEKAPESINGKNASITVKSVYNLTKMVSYDELAALTQIKDADALVGNELFDKAAARVASKLNVSTVRAQEIVSRMVEAFADFQNRIPDSAKAQKAYDYANSAIDLIYNLIPEKFQDAKLTDTYKGDGEFSFAFSTTYNPGAWLKSILDNVTITAYGRSLTLGNYVPTRDITSDISFTVTFADLYSITYVDAKGNVIFEGFLPYGAEIALYGEDAAVEDADLAWVDKDGEVITTMPGKDITVYAQYTAHPTYTITFKVLDDEFTYTHKLGEIPYHDGTLSTLNFKGWKDANGNLITGELPAVTGDATYVAVYTATITFIVDGEQFDMEVAYGETPVIDDPTKTLDLENSYVFAGWTPAIVAATEHATYTAVFEAIPHDVRIEKDGDNYKVYFDQYVANGNRLSAFVNITPALQLAEMESGANLVIVIAGNENVTGARDVTIVFDYDAVVGMLENKTEEQITLVVSSVLDEEAQWPTSAAYGDYEEIYSFDLVGSVFNKGNAEITVPFAAENKGAYYAFIDYVGATIDPMLEKAKDADTLTFTTTHFSYYAVKYVQYKFTVNFFDINGTLVESFVIDTDKGETLENVPAFTVTAPTADGHYVSKWYYGARSCSPVEMFSNNARDYDFNEKQTLEAHTYGEYDFDDVNHWCVCSVCGYELKEAHTPDNNGDCVCGYHKDVTTETEPPVTTEPGSETEPPVTTEPGSETEPPVTTEPGSETEPPVTTEPGSETEPPVTTEPGSETESDTEPVGGEKNKNGWWIFLIVLLVIVAILIVVYILYGHNIFPKGPANEEPAKEEPAKEEPEELTDAQKGNTVVTEEYVPEEVVHVDHVSVSEADELMSDVQAVHMIEVVAVNYAASGKMGAVNVGALNEHYEAGEKVDIESLKEKKLIDADCKRVKILADGDLDKALVVEANSFSLQAIKMITLTGGHALKIQNEDAQDAEDNDDAE